MTPIVPLWAHKLHVARRRQPGRLEAAELLAEIGGGVSIEPPIEGGWRDEERGGAVVWERPVRVFTYVKPERFEARIDDLRRFVHRLGRDTRQGEVAVEFAGQFWRIRRFEP